MAEKYYTVADYAKMRNITETAVYSSIKRNRLKTVDMRNEETGRTVKYVVVDEAKHIQQENEEFQKEVEIIQQLNEVQILLIEEYKKGTELIIQQNELFIQQFKQEINEQIQQQNEQITKHFEQLKQEHELRFKLLQQEFQLILEQSKHFPVFEKDYFEHFQKQLEEKDKQIQQQNELFARSQELHRQTNALLQKEEPEAAIVPAEPPKKSFFARLFNK